VVIGVLFFEAVLTFVISIVEIVYFLSYFGIIIHEFAFFEEDETNHGEASHQGAEHQHTREAKEALEEEDSYGQEDT